MAMTIANLITLDGTFTDWPADDMIMTAANTVAGYQVYGAFLNDATLGNTYVIGIDATNSADTVIGPGTTIYLNTDQNDTTGYSPFGTVGAEYEVQFALDSNNVLQPYLYSVTPAGVTTLLNGGSPLDNGISSNGESVELAIPQSLVSPAGGPAPTSISFDVLINNTTALPSIFSITTPEYIIPDPAAAPPPTMIANTITLDGTFTDWPAADIIMTPGNTVTGYQVYGALLNDATLGATYVIGIDATNCVDPVIGPNTIIYLNTDQNSETGYSPYGEVGAEYEVQFAYGPNSVLQPYLYSVTSAGVTTLLNGGAPAPFGMGSNGESVEVAIPRSLLTPTGGQAPTSINFDVAINNGAVALPADFTDDQYNITDPLSLSGPAVTLGSSAAAAAPFVVTGNLTGSYTGTLTLTDGTFTTALAYTGNGTYTPNLDTWPNGTVSASLTVSSATSSFSASAIATIEPDFGETLALAVSPATQTIGAETATFTISGLNTTETGTGNTATLVLSDSGGGANETFSFSTTATSGTYTETMNFGSAGTVTASLTFTDSAGNTLTATGTPNMMLATETVSLSGPTNTLGSAAAAAVSFVVTGDVASQSGSLTLTDGGNTLSVSVSGNGTYTENLSTWSNGVVSATLQVLDLYGNSFTASTGVTIEPDFGETLTLVGSPATETIGAETTTFTISGLNATETGTGNTATLVLSDSGGGANETFSFSTTATSGTYTEPMNFGSVGTVTASLTFTDGASNTLTAAGNNITLAAETVSLSGPGGTLGSAAAAAAAFTVIGDVHGQSGSLTLTDGGNSLTISVSSNGTYTENLATWTNGVVSATLQVLDLYGNSFTASTGVTIEPDFGETLTLAVSPANETIGTETATFAISGLNTTETGTGNTATLVLSDSGGGANETFSFSTTATSGTYTEPMNFGSVGTVTASLTFTDSAGNTLTATGTPNVMLATETVSLSGPSNTLGSAAAAAVSFVVTGDVAGQSGSLTLTDGGNTLSVSVSGNGTYTENLSTWSNGVVSATLQVLDLYGNSFTASTGVTIEPDFGETLTLAVSPANETIGTETATFAISGLNTTETGTGNTATLVLSDSGGGANETFSFSTTATSGTYTETMNFGSLGTVTASLTFTDGASNTLTAAGNNITLAAETVSLSGPGGTLGSAAAAAAAFTVIGDVHGQSGSLTLTDGGNSLTISVSSNGTYTENLATWTNGVVSATLQVSDIYGNSFTASTSATIEPDHGETVGLTGPLGLLGSSAAATAAFTVTGNLNDETGSLTLTDGTFVTALSYTGNGTYTANLWTWADGTVSATLAVSDPDGNSFGATASAAIDPDFGDAVTLTGPAGTLGSLAAAAAKFTVTGNLDDETGSLTLTEGAFSTALAYTGNGTYTANLGTWPNGTVTASLALSDPAGNSFGASATAALDVAPTVTAGATVTFTAAGGAVPLDSTLTVSDPNSGTLAGATVSIGAGFLSGDTLNFTNQNNITGTYNASTGVLILSGAASVANYQTALESIAFSSSSGNPTASGGDLSRMVSWTVSDGTASSNTATSTIVLTPPPPPLLAGTSADMILRDSTTGNYEIYDIGNNAIVAAAHLTQAALNWQVAGLGGFHGTDTSDMILRDGNTGAFEVYDISNNTVTSSAALAQVSLQWQVLGFGDFSGNAGETDMLMQAMSGPSAGDIEVYDISNNAVTATSAPIGQVGPEWTVAGFGDFSGHAGESDLIMRATAGADAGDFEVFDIANNNFTSFSAIDGIPLTWAFAGFGDFSGNGNESDMLLRNSTTGAFEIYDISNNAITSSAIPIGVVGLEWQVVGFGDLSGKANETDMLMQATSGPDAGDFEYFDISHNQLTGAGPMGAVGLNWQVGGIANDPPTAGAPAGPIPLLVNAMAAFGASPPGTRGSGPNEITGGPDTSQQALLTMLQHG